MQKYYHKFILHFFFASVKNKVDNKALISEKKGLIWNN